MVRIWVIDVYQRVNHQKIPENPELSWVQVMMDWVHGSEGFSA